ncbi:MAG TPA: bifunctional riboflavin kinase/FAD synthetase [Burkholderiaceae bacterium]|jgi:riboflavin kinase/FMN adenylyltransferase|nr:bifunctional riboflavin kinase/FAD synthetase [Burkholderiaceae bacterium]
MRVFHGLPSLAERRACALSIGNFDGVHRGHRTLLQRVVEVARQRNLVAAVMTFEPHPREYFSPEQAPARIANLRDKIEGFRQTGIERVLVQHFNRDFASLTAEQFIQQILVQGCQAQWLLVGDDFRFGARRTGDVALLRSTGQRSGFTVEQIPAVLVGGERVSSSRIRAALSQGDLALAGELLGHPYAISGRVLHGSKLGRQIGFPTLNLRVAHRRPALHGIYAVRVRGIGAVQLPGVASVGLRPTVDDSGRWLLEVHLFDFSDEVYGRLIEVEFVQKLRDEARFDSIQELTAAIRRDADQARALFDGTPA